ncbi:MAG: NAD-dependent epimerase/dehydratase family protein, partial [Actinomycetota bacterium]|nr:NAD-dependent epimerase/dehydratase family protein [Actinomycetota bacterium]
IRTEKPNVVVHMGFVRDFKSDWRIRHEVNVRGTKQLLDHCAAHGVQQLVVLSSGYVYGAFAENPYFMDEDQPLSASRSYPEIRDLVEVDTLASAYIWRHPQIRTCVLRPVNTLGPHVHSMAASLLRMQRVPTVMGFDPMMQFISESDVVEAIVAALAQRLQGVFNVVGPGEVPLHTAIEEVGRKPFVLPGPIANAVYARGFNWGLWPYPPGMLDYLRYPISLSGERFREATEFTPQVSLREIFRSMRGQQHVG